MILCKVESLCHVAPSQSLALLARLFQLADLVFWQLCFRVKVALLDDSQSSKPFPSTMMVRMGRITSSKSGLS